MVGRRLKRPRRFVHPIVSATSIPPHDLPTIATELVFV